MATSCLLPTVTPETFPDPAFDPPASGENQSAEAILAGGCFWCTEAVYRQLDGVLHVESGYSGGSADTANYKAVCTDTTGHAEVIRIVYDPRKIGYGQLLKVFFSVAHDPTQLNRQGGDVGTQYRSAVFHADDIQRDVVTGRGLRAHRHGLSLSAYHLRTLATLGAAAARMKGWFGFCAA